MNNKAFTISLVLAGLAVLMIFQYVTSQEEAIKAKYGTPTAVVIAKKNISEMAALDETMIDIIEKPKEFVEPGRMTSKEEVVGFIASVPIRKGEQITVNKIVAPGVRTGLSKQVSPGKRAISISINDVSAVSRLVKPADRVDLIATIDPPDSKRGNQITKVVAQDLSVLAVGEFVTNFAPRKVVKDEIKNADVVTNLNADRNYSTITLEVDPQLASQITLLSETQKLSIVLRNTDDTERVSVQPVHINDVLGSDTKVQRGVAAQK